MPSGNQSPHQKIITRIKFLEKDLTEARSCAALGGKSKAVLLDFARKLQTARKELDLLSALRRVSVFAPSRHADLEAPIDITAGGCRSRRMTLLRAANPCPFSLISK
jgi:hypothetical protein